MKRSVKRYLAMLLVMTLVLQQGSAMGALAGETEPTSETVAEKTTETQAAESVKKADEKKEEPKQTETQATETQAPETKAEEKKASETQATEPKQEETKASETKPEEPKTEASKTPETKPNETNAPDGQTGTQEDETQAEPESSIEKVTEQGTESEAMTEPSAETTESASEPETEKETKSEKETEAESKKETEAGPTLLKAECDGVGVSVSAAPGVLKAGTTLEMILAGKNQVYQAVLPLMDENTEIDKSHFLAYDITLKLDGQEVQPDGEVTVSFTNVPFSAGENGEIVVAHLMDASAANSSANTISAFRAMSGASTAELASGLAMKTTHFSIFAVFEEHKKKLETELQSETSEQKKQELQQAVEKFSKHGSPIPDKYVPQNTNQFTYTDDDGSEQVLNSPAFDFHIFSEEANLGGGHTNGNVATNKFSANTNFGTNQSKEDGVEEYNYVGESAEGFKMTDGMNDAKTVVGKGFQDNDNTDSNNASGNSITWNDNDGSLTLGKGGTKMQGSAAGNVYKEGDEKFIDITEELNKLSKASKQMAGQKTSYGVKMDKSDQNNARITVKGGSKIQYLNVKATDLANVKWNIEIDPYTTLIINVNMYGANADTLADFTAKINGSNNSEERVRETCNVLWNLYYQEDGGEVKTYKQENGNYTKVANSGDFFGTILAPDANIEYGPVNGSIIARKTNHTGGESHNSRFTGFSALLNITKKALGTSGTFYFAVYDAEGKQRVAGQYVKSVTLSDGESGSVQFAGLQPGTYTIWETDKDGNKISEQGYTITGNGQTVTFDGKGDKFVSIVNSKDKEFGALQITKNVRLNGVPTTKTELDGTYKFEIRKPDGTVVQTVYITIRDGLSNTVKVDGLEPGTYTVSEVDIPEGITLLDGNDRQVTVASGGTETVPIVEFTNNKGEKRELGSLKLKKAITGDLDAGQLSEDKKKAIIFTVTGPEGYTNTFSYADMTNGEKTLSNLVLGEYTVTETNANVDGYDVSTTYSVTDGKAEVKAEETASVTVTNTYTQQKGLLKIRKNVTVDGKPTTKTDADGTYTFKVEKKDDAAFAEKTVTVEIKNGQSKEATLKDLEPGTYTVTEVTDGLGNRNIRLVSQNGQEVTIGDAETVTVPTVEFTNNKITGASIVLEAKKVLEAGGKELTLKGGEFTFSLTEVDEHGVELAGGKQQTDARNAADGSVKFDEIKYTGPGRHYYKIVEVIPTGTDKDGTILYAQTSYTVTVTVEEKDGALVATADKEASELVFTNKTTTVAIDKTDKDTGASLKGAMLQITDGTGAVVEGPWETTGEPHDVTGKLKIGASYKLTEVAAPAGYTIAAPVEFSVDDDGRIISGGSVVTAITMEDAKNRVSILKVDESGKALAGAKLVVKDKDGKAAAGPWTTDGRAHEITGLPAGSYVLSEVEAPAGYDVSADVPFEITGEEAAGAVKTVTMTDRKTPEANRNSLTITKHVRVQGITSDIGVKDAVFYVALFSDAARTQRVSSVKKIEFKNTTASSVMFDKLAAGIYYVSETDENGTPLTTGMMGGKAFQPEYPDSMQFTFEGRADTKVGEFTNVFRDIPDNFYLAGELTVTKKVLLNGEPGTSNDTFYARVFTDAALTTPVDDQILALPMAGGSTTSGKVTNLPIGDTPGSSRTYYVAETDENGIPLDPSAVEFEISVDKSEIVLSGANPNGEVVITNSFTEEEESEFESEFESEEESETETEAGKKTAPKTGDDTDYMRYLLLMAFSAGLCGVAIGQKRRKAKRVRK